MWPYSWGVLPTLNSKIIKAFINHERIAHFARKNKQERSQYS
jgi:hypothetical protein